MGRGAGRKIVQNVIFRGKRHDNKILKVKILLSRNFVVMAQAPTLEEYFQGGGLVCIKFGPPPLSRVTPPSRRSYNRTLLCENPQEVTFEEPVKRYSWRDTLTVSLVSLRVSRRHS